MAKIGQPDHYKWEINKAIIDELYTESDLVAKRKIEEIIDINCTLMRYTHPSFGFNGRLFSKITADQPKPTQKLHPQLTIKMREYEHEYFYTNKMEQAKISGYIHSVTAISNLPGDYLLLLPAALHAVVRDMVSCDWSTSLSPEKIASFMAKYQSGYDAVRQRLALNLIL